MKTTTHLLIMAFFAFCSADLFAQTFGGGTTGTDQDGYIINMDLTNSPSYLRLQTNNNQGWSMLNRSTGLYWSYDQSNNYLSIGTAHMRLSTSGMLMLGSFDPLSNITGGSHTLRLDPDGNGVGIESTGTLKPHYQTSFTIYQGLLGSGQPKFHINTAGDVGIGTQTPAAKLDVVGNVKASIFQGNNVVIGTATPHAQVHLGNVLANRKIILYEDSNNDHQFAGFGTTPAILRYQVADTQDDHVFFAASSATSSAELMRIKGNGQVGIGTDFPSEKLEIAGNVKASTFFADKISLSATSSNTSYGYNAGNVFSGNGNVAIGRGSASAITNANHSVFVGYNAGSSLDHVTFEGGVNPLSEGKSVFVLNNQAQLHNPLLFGTFAHNTDHDDPAHGTSHNTMAQLAINTHHIVDSCALTVSGAVHIGPKNLDPAFFPRSTLYKDFLLWVERGVISENYAFGSVDRWSDFVFDDQYKLPPLGEVEEFIRKNKHLPQVPSEAEVKANGYDQHGMNTLFLQKIEELTLYAIELEKKLAAYSALEARIKELEKSIK